MKKLITIILLLVVVSVSAAPGDVELTITMPKAWVNDNLEAILYYKPIDTIPDPNWIDDPNDPDDFAPRIKTMTTREHITKLIKGFLKTFANRGKRKMKTDEVEPAGDF